MASGHGPSELQLLIEHILWILQYSKVANVTWSLLQVRGINVTNWAEVSSSPPIDLSMIPFRPYSQCCGLKPGNNMVDFKQDCGWENFMYPNYTAMPDPIRTPVHNDSAVLHPATNTKKQRTLYSGRKFTVADARQR